VLARLDGRRQVLWMEVRRRGKHHRVDFLGRHDLLERARPTEDLRGIHAGVSLLFRQRAEVAPGGRKLIVEHVGQRHQARAAARDEPSASSVPRPPQPSNPMRTAEFAAAPRTSCAFRIVRPPAAPRNARRPICRPLFCMPPPYPISFSRYALAARMSSSCWGRISRARW